VKQALQGAGLVARRRKRGPRRPVPGMLLHIDGSKHRWLQDDPYYSCHRLPCVPITPFFAARRRLSTHA
jgi:hypothetical protein